MLYFLLLLAAGFGLIWLFEWCWDRIFLNIQGRDALILIAIVLGEIWIIIQLGKKIGDAKDERYPTISLIIYTLGLIFLLGYIGFFLEIL